jgi:basic membrane lipoprotein Med (substrate-binding protein (PBP1-ABC) superfamily)
MRLRFIGSLLAAAAAFTFSVAPAFADGFTLSAPPKIAMILFGPKNDGGWTQAFDEARIRMEKALGQANIPYVENVPETAQKSARRRRRSSAAATTSSSAPASAIPKPSSNCQRNIRKSRS